MMPSVGGSRGLSTGVVEGAALPSRHMHMTRGPYRLI